MQMNIQERVAWTWADLISSYRFWGLFIFFSCMLSANYFCSSYFLTYSYHSLGYYGSLDLYYTISGFTGLLSLIVAWLSYRANSYYALYFLAALATLGLSVLYLAREFDQLVWGVALYAISLGALTLLISGLIAQAINRLDFFVLAFGSFKLIEIYSHFSSSISIVAVMNSPYPNIYTIIISYIIITVIGCLFLLPVKKVLFNDKPRKRTVLAIPARRQDPAAAFFLSLVPFYLIFWLIRIHSNIRNYSQSAKLLTPTAAGWSSFLFPIVVPVMLVTLSDVIDEKLDGERKQKMRWGLILVSIFFFPTAVAIVQSKLNRLIK